MLFVVQFQFMIENQVCNIYLNQRFFRHVNSGKSSIAPTPGSVPNVCLAAADTQKAKAARRVSKDNENDTHSKSNN